MLLSIPLIIAALVGDLGHEQFERRQRATRLLEQLAPLALDQLQAAAQDEDLEVKRRAEHVLDRYCRSSLPLPTDAWPWIDSLPAAWPDRAKIIQDMVFFTWWGGGPHDRDWSLWREATRLYVRDLLLRKRVSLQKVKRLLQEMQEGDRKQRAALGITP